MNSRYTKALTALAVIGGIAVPGVAQARGGSDDPPNHEQREHQVLHHGRHARVANDRRERRHDRLDNYRRDGRGSDAAPTPRPRSAAPPNGVAAARLRRRLVGDQVALGPERRLSAVADPELREHAREVGLHRLLADLQLARDQLVR